MTILGIETSCDDTCVAIIRASGKTRPRFKILSNIVSSQVEIHRKYGGVYPSLAKREHQKNLPLILKKTLGDRNIPVPSLSPIDAVAVTVGPGLEPCLWVGVNFAKDLARKWDKPIIPVNHIEAHILANFIDSACHSEGAPATEESQRDPSLPVYQQAGAQGDRSVVNFPAVCLIVSGGHTQLILMNPVRGSKDNKKAQGKQTSNGVKKIGDYKILGETRDDAAGECFDKTARILGLGFPGGPAIAAEARGQTSAKSRGLPSISLPRPMIHQKNYDFSFSGLKTAVLYDYKKRSKKIRESKKYIKTMAKEIQQAIIDVLIHKTIKAAKDSKAKTIMLGGGVAANNELRKQLKQACVRFDLTQCLIPDTKYCTDNAVMTTLAGYFNPKRGTKNWQKIKADANLRL